MTKAQEAKNNAAKDCNPHISRLLAVARKLEDVPGASSAAKELDAIIERLERWQEKHGQ